MICTLKQSLRLSMLSTLLPGDLPEEDVKRAYAAFVLRHQRCAKYFIEQVRLTAAAMFDREVTTELNVRDTPEMIVSAAILSGFTNLFAEKLVLLEGQNARRRWKHRGKKNKPEPAFPFWNAGSGCLS